MLHIRETSASDFPVRVKVDHYVPMVARTYSEPLGSVFYRIGNFRTSLVEIPIDPISGVVRGIKLVSFDRIGSDWSDEGLELLAGLPVVDPSFIPERVRDEPRLLAVAVSQRRCLIDWREGHRSEKKATHGRLCFFLGGGALLGAAIEPLSLAEYQALLAHVTRVARAD